jgi:hypothetical protein
MTQIKANTPKNEELRKIPSRSQKMTCQTPIQAKFKNPVADTKFKIIKYNLLSTYISTPYPIPAGCIPLVIIISFHLMTEL